MEITVEVLAENACHFGHKVCHWNPKMKPFLVGRKGGIHIFDLQKTVEKLKTVLEKIEKISGEGRVILFVSTKSQTKTILEEIFQKTGHPIVKNKWVGGLLTNFDTIKRRVRRLKDLREFFKTGEIDKFPKKEQSVMRREMKKLENAFAGILDMWKLPDAIFVIDGKRDKIAIREAKKIGIPIFGIADSNVDPENFTDFIPANDDAIASLTFLLGQVFERVKKSKKIKK